MKFDASIFTYDNPWYIGQTNLSHVLLNFDQIYPGRTILIPKTDYPDLESVPDDIAAQLLSDVTAIARHIKQEFKAYRMNYAALGNVVQQLHWHVIPRYMNDLNWGGPPWPVGNPLEPNDQERQSLVARIRPGLLGRQ